MIKSLIIRFRASQLAVNTSWMFAAQGMRIVVQAVYFILIARALGTQQYGAFVGVGALVAIFTPFAGLGSGKLLIRDVARDPDAFGRCWGKVLLMTAITGFIMLFAVLGGCRFILPDSIPFVLVLLIAVADIIFFQLVDSVGLAFLAVQRLDKTALFQVLPNIFRLAAIALLAICVKTPTILQWGYLYLITTVISALLGVWQVQSHIGAPVFCLPRTRAELREGFYFAVSNSALNIYNDIDKTMLARMSTLEATGIYAAAYRIIDVGFTPIRSLLFAGYAKFFQHGERGIMGSLSFAKKVFPIAAVYGLTGGILLAVAAPLLPYVLGPGFGDTTNALRWLSPLLFLKAVHYFAADTLAGADFQGVRSGIQVVVALFNVGINFLLIPLYSWRGAAFASIISDGLLAVLLCFTILYIVKRDRASALPKADAGSESPGWVA